MMKLFAVFVVFGSALAGFDQFCSTVNEDGIVTCEKENITRDDVPVLESYCTTSVSGVKSVTCKGENITEIPNHLPIDTVKLHLSNTGIEELRRNDFQRYKHIRELHMRNFYQLHRIQTGAFDGLDELRILLIIDCPYLQAIEPGVFGAFKELDTLRILKSGLRVVPDFSQFSTASNTQKGTMYEIDLSTNRILTIKTGAFTGVKSYLLRLHNNEIETIEDNAFHDSRIAILDFSNNPSLTLIGKLAFNEIQDLESLDLSKSSISDLPTEGLIRIQKINLEMVPTLKKFPSVLQFSNIKTAKLYYAHHCCAFRHPEKQNPKLFHNFQEQLKKECSRQGTTQVPESTIVTPSLKSRIRRAYADNDRPGNFGVFNVSVNNRGDGFGDTFHQGFLNGLGEATSSSKIFKDGFKFNETATLSENDTTVKTVLCGNVTMDYRTVICTPQPNALNPCEDVMGYEWLRVLVWFVVLAAICGNLLVIVVLITGKSKMTVQKFLMCNLSFADFLMGLYLLLLASIDAHSLGEYFNHAVSWQNDGGCQVAGFLTVFSSELSVFVLMVITLERWYAISHAIYVTKRLKLRQASCLMLAGWSFAVTMALLPLVGVSSYGTVSICLPMEANNPIDTGYIFSILLLNGIAFAVIGGCYVSMYFKVRNSDSSARQNDATIAKRMALLVFTNFLCWAPIAFFGLTASAGSPLIDITNSKILLVFFYPLNSCANPFLYVILTKQFRKDVVIILSRYGMCTERANKYKGTFVSRSMSNSRQNGMILHTVQNPTDISMLSTLTQSQKSSRLSLNGSTPGVTPQTTPATTPVLASKSANTASVFPCQSLLSPGDKTKERKLSTVPETGQIPDELQEIAIEVPDMFVYRDNGENRVRSCSEYVILYPARDGRRRSSKLSGCEKQSSLDTSISGNTETSFISDTSSSFGRKDSSDVECSLHDGKKISLDEKSRLSSVSKDDDGSDSGVEMYKHCPGDCRSRGDTVACEKLIRQSRESRDLSDDENEADVRQSLL